MTSEQRVTLFLGAMAGLFVLFQLAQQFFRCRYCGRLNGHEIHCPYHDSGLSGGLK